MATFQEIERLTKDYAEARANLAERVEALEAELAEARRRHITGIKRAAEAAARRREALSAAVDESRPLFEKPRTQIIHGIRVGVMKDKGQLAWDDDAQVVALIRRHLSEQADTLIKVTERPVKAALQQLTAAELKRIGVRLIETGDTVYIKPADSEIDKLVDALLASMEEPVS